VLRDFSQRVALVNGVEYGLLEVRFRIRRAFRETGEFVEVELVSLATVCLAQLLQPLVKASRPAQVPDPAPDGFLQPSIADGCPSATEEFARDLFGSTDLCRYEGPTRLGCNAVRGGRLVTSRPISLQPDRRERARTQGILSRRGIAGRLLWLALPLRRARERTTPPCAICTARRASNRWRAQRSPIPTSPLPDWPYRNVKHVDEYSYGPQCPLKPSGLARTHHISVTSGCCVSTLAVVDVTPDRDRRRLQLRRTRLPSR
jgi:hypothetical protein